MPIKKGSVLEVKSSFSNVYKGSIGICYYVHYIKDMGLYFFLFDNMQKHNMFMNEIKKRMNMDKIGHSKKVEDYEWSSDPQLINDFVNEDFASFFQK